MSGSASFAVPGPVPAARTGWRDPWLWACASAVAAPVLHGLGAPFGEPVADDWDFIHRALLTDQRSLLDGGGSAAFWRPLPHQVYYRLFAPLMLTHPLAVAAFHAVVLVLACVLAYRAARTRLPAPWAAAAASFPVLAESSRALIAWPCHMVELSFLFFSVLALHEAAFRRLPTAMLALLAALLSKEVAVVTALLLPWVPPLASAAAGAAAARTAESATAPAPGWPSSGRRSASRERLRWLLCSGGVTIAWGLAYLAVRAAHGLRLPHDLEAAAGAVETPWLGRYGWALIGGFRAAFSLPIVPSRWEILAWVGLLALTGVAAWCFATGPDARARLRAARPTVAFGLLWFALTAATIALVHPFWMPHRSLYGAFGLGVALAATLGAARPALLAGLVALRLALFAASPGAPPGITVMPPASGAFLDFEKLVRLQRVMVETREALTSRFPSLPPGARVGLIHPPIMAEYAFGGSLALQAWYRDTTLRWVRFEAFRRSGPDLGAILLYQPDRAPQMMLVEPAAMRHYLQAGDRLRREDWRGALGHLAAADSIQADTTARVFMGRVAGRRALCRLGLGRAPEAEREARRALGLWRESGEARYALASVMAFDGRRAEAEAHLDTLLRLYPDDRSARVLQDSLRTWAPPAR